MANRKAMTFLFFSKGSFFADDQSVGLFIKFLVRFSIVRQLEPYDLTFFSLYIYDMEVTTN